MNLNNEHKSQVGDSSGYFGEYSFYQQSTRLNQNEDNKSAYLNKAATLLSNHGTSLPKHRNRI